MKKSFLLLALIASVAHAAQVGDVRVRVTDDFGGDTSSVLTRCQTKEGTPYDPVTVTRDVTSLRDSGEFEEISTDVEAREDGCIDVTFVVKRKIRFVAPLTAEGNQAFSISKIMREADLKDGQLYGIAELAMAASKVEQSYSRNGYPFASVTPVTKPVGEMGDARQVTFIIDEGQMGEIDEFVFENAPHADVDELRRELGIYPWWNYKGWFTEAPTTPERRAQCREKIVSYYRNRGFLDVGVSAPRLEPAGDGRLNVVFKVDEGTRYTIGATSIVGLTRYPEGAVAEKSHLPSPGDVASAKAIDEAAHRVMVTVGSGDVGLADTRVTTRCLPMEEDPTKIEVVFKVVEGHPVVINEVVVEGNEYTKDKVIRREIALGPGDRWLEDRAERSQRRLENLNYFSRVRYYLRDRPDLGRTADGAIYRDLVYEVDEKNTGAFMVGIGASSVDSIYVSADVSQSNFDLFAPQKLFRGGGQKGRLYAQVGPRIQSYEASVTEPHLFDRLLELTVEVYRRQRWYDDYDIVRTGASASLAYPVKFWPTWSPFGRFGIRLTGEYIDFEDIEHGEMMYNGHVVSLDDEKHRYGGAWEVPVRFFWSHDTRDSYFFPTSGSRTQIFADLAGGDNSYWRLGFNHRTYFNTWRRFGHVLMVAFRAETIDAFSDDVPIYNRLFLGGPKSVRGVEYRYVSPYAHRESGKTVPWGGQTLFCLNFEYTVPIVKMVRVAAFTDLGSVGEDSFDFDFSDTFVWSAGLGLRFDLPSFPIRLDFAEPFKKPSHCEKETFSFSVGYDF